MVLMGELLPTRNFRIWVDLVNFLMFSAVEFNTYHFRQAR